MLLVQYIVLFIVIAVLIKSFSNLRKRKISLGTFILIFLLLDILAVIVFIPYTVNMVSNLIGIERGKDLMIYGAIAILFYLLFKNYIQIEILDRQISDLVKKISLNQLK